MATVRKWKTVLRQLPFCRRKYQFRIWYFGLEQGVYKCFCLAISPKIKQKWQLALFVGQVEMFSVIGSHFIPLRFLYKYFFSIICVPVFSLKNVKKMLSSFFVGGGWGV